MGQTRLLIIDEHEAVRKALVSRLQQTGQMQVVGSTSSWEEGILQIQTLHPHVVLLETKRSDGAGLETCRRIARNHPETAIVVLTSYEDEKERQEAFMAGATGYILKDIDSAELLQEILNCCPNERPAN